MLYILTSENKKDISNLIKKSKNLTILFLTHLYLPMIIMVIN